MDTEDRLISLQSMIVKIELLHKGVGKLAENILTKIQLDKAVELLGSVKSIDTHKRCNCLDGLDWGAFASGNAKHCELCEKSRLAKIEIQTFLTFL